MSPAVVGVFLLNITVGTGALALPLIFSKAGLLLGSLFMILVAFLAWAANTFAVEAMSVSNAVMKLQAEQGKEDSKKSDCTPLLVAPAILDFRIDELTEYGMMAELLLGKKGRIAWFTTIIIYFYKSRPSGLLGPVRAELLPRAS